MAGISILGIFGAYKEKKWALITVNVLYEVYVCLGLCALIVSSLRYRQMLLLDMHAMVCFIM